MFDTLIKGGQLADGQAADVAIADGRIVGVGTSLGRARVTVDARHRMVVPGFIDIHTHSDFTLPLHPAAPAKLLQGVTTDCTGNCGFSPFPLGDDAHSRSHGSFFDPLLTQRWPSLDTYARDVEAAGLGINVAPLVGLGAIRLNVLGDLDQPANLSALEEMQALTRSALDAGAFGASSGLVYAPSSFADVSELAALASVVAERDGFYATHMRNEGDTLELAAEEAFAVGRKSGCTVQISHLKALQRRNWGKLASILRRIDEENAAGQDIWADVYPYTAGSTTLMTLLPAEELRDGLETLCERIRNPAQRARIATLVETAAPFALDDVVLALVPSRTELGGRRLVDAAAEAGVQPAELVLQLIAENGTDASAVLHGMDEGDLRHALAHPRVMLGSDGWTMSTQTVPYAHPRSFAYSIRMLSRYAAQNDGRGFADAIVKLSSLPARRLRLHDRGFIAVGAVADIVVLDREQLSEVATFENPCVHPTGVDCVLVAGMLAVEGGELTGARAGRVLRSTGATRSDR